MLVKVKMTFQIYSKIIITYWLHNKIVII